MNANDGKAPLNVNKAPLPLTKHLPLSGAFVVKPRNTSGCMDAYGTQNLMPCKYAMQQNVAMLLSLSSERAHQNWRLRLNPQQWSLTSAVQLAIACDRYDQNRWWANERLDLAHSHAVHGGEVFFLILVVPSPSVQSGGRDQFNDNRWISIGWLPKGLP